MKGSLVILIVLILLVLTLLVAFAGTEVEKEASILLKPGQSAAVICDDHQTPEVRFLRVGGVRAICPLADNGLKTE